MAYSRGVKIVDEISEQIISTAMGIAKNDGVSNITVTEILRRMEITNRVFYNRFQNIDEVLVALYKRIVSEMRECVMVKYDGKSDFYEYLVDITVSVLEKTYKTKLHFAGYMFEYDSYAENNREWWLEHIRQILDYGIEHGKFRKHDTTLMAYSVWCFCRGFNASAVGSGLSVSRAIEAFRLSFGCLIRGLKP